MWALGCCETRVMPDFGATAIKLTCQKLHGWVDRIPGGMFLEIGKFFRTKALG